MKQRNLPLLLAGQPYAAVDFQRFEYFGAALTGSKAILRLHLKNATTIDLPVTDDALRHLMVNLCDAFPKEATEFVVDVRGWARPK